MYELYITVEGTKNTTAKSYTIVNCILLLVTTRRFYFLNGILYQKQKFQSYVILYGCLIYTISDGQLIWGEFILGHSEWYSNAI